MEGFNITPKLTTEGNLEAMNAKIEEIWTAEIWSVWEKYNTLSNNLDSQTDCCTDSRAWIYAWIYVIIRWIAISLTIYLIILFVFFWFYKYKKDKHPFKQALKKSRLWGIIVPILVFGVAFLISYY